MVFNIYFDPQIIGVAAASTPYGFQALGSVLRGFVANCLLFDFEDNRGHTEIGRRLEEAPNDFGRSVVKKLFAALAKRNRFVYVLEADYYSTDSDLDQAFGQAVKFDIQLFLTDQVPKTTVSPNAECVTLTLYPGSNFEAERDKAATTGRTYAGGERLGRDFLNYNFANLLRHARRIEICDRFVGERFADNFENTMREFFRFLEPLLHDPAATEIVIHCGESARNAHFCGTLASFRGPRTAAMKITVNFYRAATQYLPHERYAWTDQFGLLVGRGMDFLDVATGRNRDVSIDLKDEGEVAKAVASYSWAKINVRTV